jgi:hypothetical protein
MFCSKCGRQEPAGARYCSECGSPTVETSNLHAERDGPEPFVGDRGNVPSFSAPDSRPWFLYGLLGFFLVAFVILVAGGSFVEKVQVPVAPAERQSAIPPVIDIPRLAFAPRDTVNKVLGKPVKVASDRNLTNWKEADLIQVTYRRAVCGFLDGRLVNIEYQFAKHLSTAAELLSASGFPESAAAVDDGHLPFRAMLNPFKNPISYRGVVYYSVLFGEHLNEISVVIASVNDHFADWPDGLGRLG